ncbi:MAG: hypothetical protein JSS96_16225 [Bacteroidetes bacterium]|nr:hypothetical protein [Bacteroidota bacterium]
MKKYWKTIGLVALAAGVLYYPAMRIYKAMAAKKAQQNDNEDEKVTKDFTPSLRGDHKPHRRKATAHGYQG